MGGRTGEGRGKAEVEVGRGSEGRRASREEACWVDGWLVVWSGRVCLLDGSRRMGGWMVGNE